MRITNAGTFPVTIKAAKVKMVVMRPYLSTTHEVKVVPMYSVKAYDEVEL